ncbi:MAG: maleylpyruvate isomerase N-terminal domain-containing protein [Actinomycetota bacterium]
MIPSKREALTILERGHREVARLIDELPARALTTTGIGGGAWSPADLVGHLAAWEGFALGALDAWARRERAPIDIALDEHGLNAVNAEALAEASSLRPSALIRRSVETHAALVAAVRAVPADRWVQPPSTRGRPLGLRVGSILGGPGGPFRHADAHLPDLRAFVSGHARRS